MKNGKRVTILGDVLPIGRLLKVDGNFLKKNLPQKLPAFWAN
jgi:hypothetical protein